MTAYTKSTNFATKDTLTSGDPLKIVKGTEINTEFDNIATAVNSKSDTASPTFTGTVTIPTLSVSSTSTLTGVATLTANPVLSAGTANGVTYLNGSKSLTSGTSLVFDGTNLGIGTTSPTAKLDILDTVNGQLKSAIRNSNAGSSAYTQLLLGNDANASAAAIILNSSTNTALLGGANSLNIYHGLSAPIAFQTNGTERMRIDSVGNVGIGITPATWTNGKAIQLSGTNYGLLSLEATNATATFRNWAVVSNYINAGELNFVVGASQGAQVTTAGVVATINSSGNVGIGVTPSAWGGLKAVEVGALGTSLFAFSATDSYFTQNAYFGASWTYASTAAASTYRQSAGIHYWNTAPSGTIGTTPTFTTRMLLDNSGNLGLGVTPSAWLSTTKALQIGAYSALWQAQGNGTNLSNNVYRNASAADTYLNTAAASSYSQNAGAHSWSYAASGTAGNAITFTTAMTLDASGNLGIGTSSPSVKLQVASGDVTFSNTVQVTKISSSSTTATNQPTLSFEHAGNNTYSIKGGSNLQFYSDTLANLRMTLDNAGNLQLQAGAVMPYAPAPTGIAAATTLTNANIQGQIISATGTTYTITMPLGTTLETLATWATTNISYDFYVINTATGVITMAVNTNVTSLGSLTVAIGASAHFRIRRTSANNFVLYRLS